MISVKTIVDDVTEGFGAASRVIPRVTQMALNQTGRKARTRTRRALRDVIKPRRGRAKKVNDKIQLRPATVSNKVATITVKRLAIGAENVRGARLQVNKRGKREKLTLTYEGKRISGGFRNNKLGGKQPIFRRTQRARARGRRLPIKRVFAYGPVQQIEKRRIFEKDITQPTLSEFETNFRRIFNLRLQKLGLI